MQNVSHSNICIFPSVFKTTLNLSFQNSFKWCHSLAGRWLGWRSASHASVCWVTWSTGQVRMWWGLHSGPLGAELSTCVWMTLKLTLVWVGWSWGNPASGQVASCHAEHESHVSHGGSHHQQPSYHTESRVKGGIKYKGRKRGHLNCA